MRPGFFICICSDPEIINDFVDVTIGGFSGKWDKKILWGDEDVMGKFFNLFRSSSLLPKKEAIILRQSQKLPKRFWDKLSRFLNRFYPDLCPFICIEGEWSGKRPPKMAYITDKKYYKFAKKNKWIFEHPGVDEQFLVTYLKKWAKDKKIIISSQVFSALVDILPRDLASIKSELRKLELLVQREIRVQDLKIISPSFEYNVFEIIDSIEGISNKDEVWSIILKKDINSIDGVLSLLKLLIREANIFLQIINNESSHIPPWLRRKKEYIARRVGIEGIIQMYNVVMEADFKIKTTNINPGVLFQGVVKNLQEIFYKR